MSEERITERMFISYCMEELKDKMSKAYKDKGNHMIAQLDKKSAKSGEHKPTKTQLQNVVYKADIQNFLVEHPTERFTVTDFTKKVKFDKGAELSVNKVSALMKQMTEAGIVRKETDKGTSLFSYIAPDTEV